MGARNLFLGQLTLYLAATALALVALAATASAANVMVLTEDADSPPAEDAAFRDALAAGGHTMGFVEPEAFAANGLDPAAWPLLAVDRQSTTIPAAYATPEFGAALRAYMDAGGHLLAVGAAAELLDTSRVTKDVFSYQSTSGGLDIWFRVGDAAHDITEAYPVNTLVHTNRGNVLGSYATSPPTDASVRVLGATKWAWADWRGTFYAEIPGALAVVHHGNGTAVSLAGVSFGSQSPTAGLTEFLHRVADGARSPEFGGLRVAFDGGSPGFTGTATTVTATVTATGGATVPGASVTLRLPNGVTILGGAVDGVAQESGLHTYLLGNLSTGDVREVEWTLRHAAQGLARYSVDAASTANRVDAVTAAGLKHIHAPGALATRIAVLDTGDASVAPTATALRGMGWAVDTFVPQDVDENRIDAAAHGVLVVPHYSDLPEAVRRGSFGAGVRAYMDAGGDLVLLGTAGELLDVVGVTADAVGTATTGSLTSYVRVTSTNHPVTSGFGGTHALSSGSLTGSVLTTVAPDAGALVLGAAEYDWSDWRGVHRAPSGNGLYVVPHGDGKAFVLAAGSFSSGAAPTDALHTLVLRVLDAAETDHRAHLRVALDTHDPSRRGVNTTVTATVTAVGGGSASGASVTLTYPAGATLLAAAIDGAPAATLKTVTLGDLASGESRSVTWTLSLPTLGVNDFSARAVSSDARIPAVTASAQKANHREGTVGERVALVDLGDATAAATRRELELLGYEVDLVSTYDFDTRRLDPAVNPVAIVYYYGSVLPLALTQSSFGDGIKAYMEAGGDVVLLGTAGEILDTAGITDDAVGLATTGTLTQYVRVTSTEHLATEAFGGLWALGNGHQLGAVLQRLDAALGIRVLATSEYDWSDWRGVHRAPSGNGLYVVPHENGKAYGLATGIFGANAPTDAFRTLMLRVLDSAEADDVAALRVDFDAGPASDRGAPATVTATVTAVGGGSAPGVTATVALPAGTSLVGGSVDGSPQPLTLLTYELGAIPSGESRTVAWTVTMDTLGPNTFTTTATPASPYAVGVTGSGRTFNHVPGGLEGRVAIVDLLDGKAGPLKAALEGMGYATELVRPYDVDNGRVLPSATDRLVIYCYDAALPVDLSQASFTTGLKEYLEAGGDVVLLGTAGEVLDAAGITANAINVRTTGSLTGYVRVTDANHLATDALGGAVLALNNGPQVGALLDVVDRSVGIRVLGASEYDWSDWRGVHRAASGSGLYVVPHGHGKATALATGVFGSNSPTSALENLAMRVLDAASVDDLAVLKVDFSPLAAAEENAGSLVEARVTAYGGGTLPEASVTITVPADTTILSGQVDGDAQPRVLPRYELGGLQSGETHVVRWEVASSGLGVHDFSVRAESTATRVPVVTDAGKKDVHMTGALAATIGLVDLGDAEGDAILERLQWMGWAVRTFTPAEIKDGAASAGDVPVLVLYTYAAALPAPLAEAAFLDGLRAYASDGGNLVLLASAGEILDALGYTPGQFTIRDVGSGGAYFQTTDATHPVTLAFGGTRLVNTGGQLGAVIPTLDGSLGIQPLADARYYTYDWRGNAIWNHAGLGLGVAPAGGGRAVFASTLRFGANSPTDDATNYLSRIVDYQVAYTVAPRTTVTLSGTEGVERWFRSAVEVTLTAVPGEEGHAVAATYYRLGGGDFVRYDAPFTVTTEAANVLEAYSVDVAGNEEFVKRVAVKIDYTAPTASVLIGVPQVDGNPRPVVGPGTKFTLRGTDALSGTQLLYSQVDAGTELTYSGPFTLAVYDEGPHEIAASAKDRAGNLGERTAIEVYLDVTPPRTRLTFGNPGALQLGDTVHATKHSKFVLSAWDATAGAKDTWYAIDGATPVRYTGPFTVNRPDGAYALEFWSTDKVGNQEAPRRLSVQIDSTGPSALSNLVGPYVFDPVTGRTYVSFDTLVAFGAEAGATTYFRINGGALQVYESPISFDAAGSYRIEYYAVDATGNVGASATLELVLDATPPLVEEVIGGGVTVDGTLFVGRAGEISLSGTDAEAGVGTLHYRVNGGAWLEYGAPFRLDGPTGAYVIEYYGVDLVGNEGARASLEVFLDITRPTASSGCEGVGCAVRDATTFVSAGGRIALSGLDEHVGLASVKFSLDGGISWEVYAGGIDLPDVEGLVRILYYAEDLVGNLAPVREILSFVDLTLPRVESKLPATKTWTSAGGETYVGTDAIELVGADPESGGGASGIHCVFYSVNGGSFTVYDGGIRIDVDGVYEITYYAWDLVRNEGAPVTITVRVDRTPPATELVVGEPEHRDGTWYVGLDAPLTLQGEDPLVNGVASGLDRIEYRIGDAEWLVYDGPFSLAGPDGLYTLEWRGVDRVGNVEPTRVQPLYLDTHAPIATVEGAEGILRPGENVTVTALDPLVGGDASGVATLEASIDGNPWFPVVAPFSVGDRDGVHTLRVRTVDRVANAADVLEVEVRVDGTAPALKVEDPERASVFAGIVVLGGDADGDLFPTPVEDAFGSDPTDRISTPVTRDVAPPLDAWAGEGELAWTAADGGVEARGLAGRGRLEADLPRATGFMGVTVDAAGDGVTGELVILVTTDLAVHAARVPLAQDEHARASVAAALFEPPVPPTAALQRATVLVEAAEDDYAGAAAHVRAIRVHALRVSAPTADEVAGAALAALEDALATLPAPPAGPPTLPTIPSVCLEDACYPKDLEVEPTASVAPAPDASPVVATLEQVLGDGSAALRALVEEHLGDASVPPPAIPDADILLREIEAAVSAAAAALDETAGPALDMLPPPPEDVPAPPVVDVPGLPVEPGVEAPEADAPRVHDFLVAIGNVTLRASARDHAYADVASGVARIAVALDGLPLAVASGEALAHEWHASGDVAGIRALEVTAEDAVGHVTSARFRVLLVPASEAGAAATLAHANATAQAGLAAAVLQAELTVNETHAAAASELDAAPGRVEGAQATVNETAAAALADVKKQFPLVVPTFDPTSLRVRDDDLDGVPAVWARPLVVTVPLEGEPSAVAGEFAPTGLGDPDDADPARRVPGEWPLVLVVPDPTGFRVRDDDLDGAPAVWARDLALVLEESGALSVEVREHAPMAVGDRDDADPAVGVADVPEAPTPPDAPDVPDAPGAPDVPEPPAVPALPDAPGVPAPPEAPALPDAPDAPDTGDVLPEGPPPAPPLPSPEDLPDVSPPTLP